METYPDLIELLRGSREAREYFASLPEAVRTSVNDRPDAVNSLDSLKSYVDNFWSGN